jgi:hypothetical protein
MGRKNAIVAIAVAVLGVCLIIDCSDKGTNTPASPANYQLIVNYLYDPLVRHSPTYYMTVSTANDSILDSTFVGTVYTSMVFSHDGATAYYTGLEGLRITDGMVWGINWQTGDTVAIHRGHFGEELSISSDDRYLFSCGQPYVTLHQLPDLSLVYADTTNCQGGLIMPHHSRAFYFRLYDDSLSYVDYATSPPVKHRLAIRDDSGAVAAIQTIGSTLSGDTLMVIAGRPQRALLILIDADNLCTLKFIDLPFHYYSGTSIVPMQNRNRFVFYFPGNGPEEGIVYSLTLPKGEISVMMDENDFDFTFGVAPPVMTPDDEYMYVLCGNHLIKQRLHDGEISVPITKARLEGYSLDMNPRPLAK